MDESLKIVGARNECGNKVAKPRGGARTPCLDAESLAQIDIKFSPAERERAPRTDLGQSPCADAHF
jgi:hypothetical protein